MQTETAATGDHPPPSKDPRDQQHKPAPSEAADAAPAASAPAVAHPPETVASARAVADPPATVASAPAVADPPATVASAALAPAACAPAALAASAPAVSAPAVSAPAAVAITAAAPTFAPPSDIDASFMSPEPKPQEKQSLRSCETVKKYSSASDSSYKDRRKLPSASQRLSSMIVMGKLLAAPKMLEQQQTEKQTEKQTEREQVTFQGDGKPRVGKGHVKRMKQEEEEVKKTERRSRYEEWKRQVLGGSKEKHDSKVIPTLSFAASDLSHTLSLIRSLWHLVTACAQNGDGDIPRAEGKQLSIARMLAPLDRRQVLARAAEERRERGGREHEGRELEPVGDD
eukprot:748080-Hanusia_phi.AAC.2